jgi:hypothetical protein
LACIRGPKSFSTTEYQIIAVFRLRRDDLRERDSSIERDENLRSSSSVTLGDMLT